MSNKAISVTHATTAEYEVILTSLTLSALMYLSRFRKINEPFNIISLCEDCLLTDVAKITDANKLRNKQKLNACS
mgnify:CR=1 FL=1